MKKISAIFLTVTLLIVCFAVSAAAVNGVNPSARIIKDVVLKATPRIDAKLDAAYLQSMQVKINPPKYAGVETDVRATVYALYDDSFVYVFYQVENDRTLLTADDEYIQDHPHPSHNDAVELRIGDDLEEKLPEYTGSNAAHHLFIMDAYGKRFSCYEDTIEDYLDKMLGKAEIVSATAYNVEMRIPLANSFAEGDIINFNFQIDDCQNAAENETGYVGLGKTYMTLVDFTIGGAAPGGTTTVPVPTPVPTPTPTPTPVAPVDPVEPDWEAPVVDDPVVDMPDMPDPADPWEDYPAPDYDYEYDEPVTEDPNYDYDYDYDYNYDYDYDDYQVPTSGTIDGIYWKIVGTTLTLSGSGAIPDYSDETGGLPWDKHIETVERLIIKSGIKSVGAESFSWYSSLKEVVVESGLEKIDSMAFYKCTSLKKVTLPSTVNSIANSAFESVSPSFKISAIDGSYAQSYSESHGFTFESPAIAERVFTHPTKMSYKVGDKLELDGVMLEYTYENGECVFINDPDEFTADITEFNEAGEIGVTVAVDGDEYSFTVEVSESDEDDEEDKKGSNKKKNDDDDEDEDEEEESSEDNTTLIIVAIAAGVVLILVVAGVVIFTVLRGKKNKNQQ